MCGHTVFSWGPRPGPALVFYRHLLWVCFGLVTVNFGEVSTACRLICPPSTYCVRLPTEHTGHNNQTDQDTGVVNVTVDSLRKDFQESWQCLSCQELCKINYQYIFNDLLVNNIIDCAGVCSGESSSYLDTI